MNHVAVMGTSRSGTTALVQLLNGSPHLAIGMERYKFRLAKRPQADEVRALFEPERFLDFQEEDTNIIPGPDQRFAALYEDIERKLAAGSVRWIGDKMSPSRVYLQTLEAAFPDLHIIFIMRDVLNVAASYVRRALNPADKNWPSDRRHNVALKDWLQGLNLALAIAERSPERLHVVTYESLYGGDRATLEGMAAFLGVPIDDAFEERYEEILAAAENVAGKEFPLSDADVREMAAGRDPVAERKVLDLAAAHRLRSGHPHG